jgi:hypothetical protein
MEIIIFLLTEFLTMKQATVLAGLLLCLGAAHAQQTYEPREVPGLEALLAAKEATTPAPAAADLKTAVINEFCLFKGAPPSDIKYNDLGRVKHGKGTYGAAKDIVHEIVAQAKDRGANAIINYSGAQRFGFWPWRMIRPVVQGTAVTLQGDKPLNCSDIGGTPLSKVMTTGEGPSK